MRSDQGPLGDLLYREDYTSQLHEDCNRPWNKSPYINQSVLWNVNRVWFMLLMGKFMWFLCLAALWGSRGYRMNQPFIWEMDGVSLGIFLRTCFHPLLVVAVVASQRGYGALPRHPSLYHPSQKNTHDVAAFDPTCSGDAQRWARKMAMATYGCFRK